LKQNSTITALLSPIEADNHGKIGAIALETEVFEVALKQKIRV